LNPFNITQPKYNSNYYATIHALEIISPLKIVSFVIIIIIFIPWKNPKMSKKFDKPIGLSSE